ncbi:MAG TPA: xanthine dehydrogenase family protein molybdopterin-binding subunit [Candidatus Limnocylindria bacterium]|jgi:carbon-monoxide dehydrogenase large subunit|nr:xanthine dehydrogenase family protein molybdopterin-binding subunit [Candidatus Limnocylindria bacterium]
MAFTAMVGARIRRREDPRLITGRATYVDDVKQVGTVYAAFVRSPYGHAKLTRVDLSAAKEHPAVLAAYCGEDLHHVHGLKASLPVAHKMTDLRTPPHWILALDEVRFVGEPVAVVVASSAYAARDAAELVAVEYEPLAAVVDPLQAAAGPPYVHADLGTNVAFTMPFSAGEPGKAFEEADVVIAQRIVNQRVAPVPIEPRSMVANWDAGNRQLTLHSATQIPHLLRTQLSVVLGLPENHIRAIAPEVGGGFGAKLNVYAEEAVVSWLAIQLERPVKYVETRSECFQAMIHGRDQIDDLEIAVKRDGTITGLKLKITANMGAYHQLLTPVIPTLSLLMAPGCYMIPNIAAEVVGVFTNTMSTDAYRGAGRPEATFFIERAMDLVAQKLQLDPAEVRRRNFIARDAFPHTTATGLTYDSGDYATTMEKALALADYTGLRKKQAELRAQGRYLGIGLSTYVEVCGMGPSAAMPAAGWDSATIRIEPTGSVTVLTGISPHGQGQETTFAQIVADELGVPIDQITVVHGDTDKVQYGVGTFGSRGTAVGGAALKLAIETIQQKALKIAAFQWEASPHDLEYRNGKIQIKGDPSKTMTTAEAGFLAFMGDHLPPGLEPGLDATRRFEPPNFVFPFGTHVCVVEVDAQTGEVKVLKYLAVDDCGPLINPLIVEGQVHGGIAQGLAQALYEQVVYDENGQLLTGTLMDYAVPHAEQVPHYELDHTVTPTTVNPLGIKGVGEAGTIGSTPAVANAVIDALAPFGVTHIDMPLRPEKLWAAMHAAEGYMP